MLPFLRKLSSPASGAAPDLLDRDHSLIAFNERVFDWAVRDDVPLMERLRYLCIVSSNLDESLVLQQTLVQIVGSASPRASAESARPRATAAVRSAY